MVKVGASLAVIALIAAPFIVIGAFTIAVWPLIAILLAIIFLVYYLHARRFGTSIAADFRQSMINMYVPAWERFHMMKNVVFRVWSNANPVKNDLVADSMVRLLDQNVEATSRFCETLSIYRLRSACYVAGLRSGNKATSQIVDADGTIVNVAKAARRSSIDSLCEKLLRDYLGQRVAASREVRRSVILRVMDTSDVRQLVNRAIEDATARIQNDNPGVFDMYDRVHAEGELRRGSAAPLGVALSSVCALYTANIWLMLSAALPATFIYFSGMKKQEEATRIVVSFIAAKITPINLEVNDVRLLRWQIKQPSHEVKIVLMMTAIASTIRSLIHFRHNSGTPMLRSDVEVGEDESRSPSN